jgi:hypothetical protein
MNDPIDHLLSELSTKCSTAWKGKGTECAACPVGEVAELVAAALTFYREHRGAPLDVVGGQGGKVSVGDAHWSNEWRRIR